MPFSENLQTTSTTTMATPGANSAQPSPSALHLQFLDLTLDPLPDLKVRVTLDGKGEDQTTDADGQINGIQANPGLRVLIEVQRFDGSYKEIEDAPMPASDTTWNYISPQLVLDAETQLHEGETGHAEKDIPSATHAHNDDPSTGNDPTQPQENTRPPAPPSRTGQVATAESTPPPRTAPRPARQTSIRGGTEAPARKSPQITGRTTQGTPMTVLLERMLDWWGHWTLPTVHLWHHHGHGSAPTHAGQRTGKNPSDTGSKVPYAPSMLPKVQTLIQFAQEQTEYEYGKAEGTAAVVAQMAKRQFKHVTGEKRSRTSVGRCYQYVRIALTRASIVDGFLADTAPAQTQASASLAGQPLLDKGFADVTEEVPDARWAATGDVIVYSWSAATWSKRKNKYGADVPNHGHIDIRSEDTYISDFIPANGHPEWRLPSTQSPTGFEPGYVNIRIYRKCYDPRPTCRMRAFLACLREYETQAIKNDADRYRALSTPLPGTHHPTSFNGFAAHPWSKIPRSSWAPGTSTASGAYQHTVETAEGLIRQRMLFDLEGGDLFTPLAQDRLAVILMEEKGALPAIRQGDLDAAVKALRSTWSSLPGASQNHARRTASGQAMDMAYLRGIYARALAAELAKFGIFE